MVVSSSGQRLRQLSVQARSQVVASDAGLGFRRRAAAAVKRQATATAAVPGAVRIGIPTAFLGYGTALWGACQEFFDVAAGGMAVSRAEFEENLADKMQDEAFLEDLRPLLLADLAYEPDPAASLVRNEIISKIPGAPWKGPPHDANVCLCKSSFLQNYGSALP